MSRIDQLVTLSRIFQMLSVMWWRLLIMIMTERLSQSSVDARFCEWRGRVIRGKLGEFRLSIDNTYRYPCQSPGPRWRLSSNGYSRWRSCRTCCTWLCRRVRACDTGPLHRRTSPWPCPPSQAPACPRCTSANNRVIFFHVLRSWSLVLFMFATVRNLEVIEKILH